jgi:hypothetical protein
MPAEKRRLLRIFRHTDLNCHDFQRTFFDLANAKMAFTSIKYFNGDANSVQEVRALRYAV